MDLYWYDCSPIVLQPVSFRKFLSGTGSVVNWDNITKLDRQIFCFVPDKVLSTLKIPFSIPSVWISETVLKAGACL